jgi:hypothetical protein
MQGTGAFSMGMHKFNVADLATFETSGLGSKAPVDVDMCVCVCVCMYVNLSADLATFETSIKPWE